jgi:hypothetical protein
MPGLVAQSLAHACLPCAGAQRRDLLGNLAHCGENERPRKLCGGVRGSSRMLAGRHDHAVLRAGFDIDMRINAPLAN